MQLSNSFYDICMIYVFKKKEVTPLENKIQIEQALLKRSIIQSYKTRKQDCYYNRTSKRRQTVINSKMKTNILMVHNYWYIGVQ